MTDMFDAIMATVPDGDPLRNTHDNLVRYCPLPDNPVPDTGGSYAVVMGGTMATVVQVRNDGPPLILPDSYYWFWLQRWGWRILKWGGVAVLLLVYLISLSALVCLLDRPHA